MQKKAYRVSIKCDALVTSSFLLRVVMHLLKVVVTSSDALHSCKGFFKEAPSRGGSFLEA